jgi:serine protease Do
MKLKAYIVTLALVLVAASIPVMLLAQPGGQPYIFYGEEPWGGSYLGVDTRDITKDRLEALHLKEERGVEVTMVDQDAPAGKAGLKEHDVILSVNNQPVESVEQLRRMIHEIPSGRTVNLGVSRNGQPLTLSAQLADRNKFAKMEEHDFNINVPAIHIPQINIPEMDLAGPMIVMHSPSRSGLLVENLSPQLGEFFGVKNGSGVLVRSVEKGSRAEQAGFRAGDVVLKVNGSAVNDSGDFLRLLRSRTEAKASVTILRDRKEQTLTLTLPEPRKSGSIKGGDDDEDDDESMLLEDGGEIAAVAPGIVTAELKRVQPELAKARKEMKRANKELQREMTIHGAELKKEMEIMKEELQQQHKELELEIKRWSKDLEI